MLERDRLFHPVTGSVTAVVLMLLCAGLVSHADHYHANRQNYEYNEPNAVEAAPPFLRPSSGAKAIARETNEQPGYDPDLRSQERMADAAWAAVYSSLFLIGLTIHFARMAWLAAKESAAADNAALELTRTQLSEARLAASEQADQMNRQVWATQDTARAAQRHAMITQDVAARQSRCYIEPIGGTFIRPDPETATLLTDYSKIEIKCVNHGSSIGKEIYCLYEVEVIDLDNRTGTLGWREFEPELKSGHPNVAPKSDFSISLELNAVQRVEEVPYDGRSLVLVRGAVYYRDVFDEEFRSGFVLLALFPINSGLVAREIPFGMSQSSQDRPTFERVYPTEENQ